MLLELCQGALKHFAPAVLVGQPCLDPSQGLRDRVILLLEPLEAVVDRIEVPERLLPKLDELVVHCVEPAVHCVEPVTHCIEPVTHLGEPAIDLGELVSQKFDELLVLGRGHTPCLSQVQARFKCVRL
jgi:hypothetical protein